MGPLLPDQRWRVDHASCLDWLRAMPDGYAHACVTSPPYWGLRDYGCDGQIGLEPTPEEYVAKMVEVFRDVRRVLRPDASLWLNLGDCYCTVPHGPKRYNATDRKRNVRMAEGRCGNRQSLPGLKHKDMVGIPWRVAFALQADGWWLRSDCIWWKRNAMCESVKDRPARSHEYVFLLTKSPRYYFDMEAVKEKASGTEDRPQLRRAKQLFKRAGLTDAHLRAIRSGGVNDTGKTALTQTGKCSAEVARLAAEAKAVLKGYYREFLLAPSRSLRSVWNLPTMPHREAHFAVMAPKLARRCVLASTSEEGCCSICSAPWRRVVERERKPTRPGTDTKVDAGKLADSCAHRTDIDPAKNWRNTTMHVGNRDPQRHVTETRTLGWEPGCKCEGNVAVPCRVIDPFVGFATTLVQAVRYGRVALGPELNEAYCALARKRLDKERALFA